MVIWRGAGRVHQGPSAKGRGVSWDLHVQVTHSSFLLPDDSEVHLLSNHSLSCFNTVCLLGLWDAEKALAQPPLINPWLATKCLWAFCWDVPFP